MTTFGSSLDPISAQWLQELAGTRSSRVASRAAVRKSDVTALVSLPAMTSTQETGSTVTVADYNALQADLATLWAAIQQIAAKVKT